MLLLRSREVEATLGGEAYKGCVETERLRDVDGPASFSTSSTTMRSSSILAWRREVDVDGWKRNAVGGQGLG